MKIAIDLRMWNASGIGTYLKNIIPFVVEAYPKVDFCLLSNPTTLSSYLSSYKNVKIINYQPPIYSISEQLISFRKIPKDISLFWSPHYNIPLFFNGKMLVTIYDLFHIAMPKMVRGLHKQLYARFMFKNVLKKADKIITISNFTKSEFLRMVGDASPKIHSIYLGVDESWFNIRKEKSPHKRPFLLFVGNVKPHKNLSQLIKSFQLIADKIPHDLVIVGEKEGFITGDKKVLSESLKLGDRIYLTGFVEENILKQYFSNADAFIFPSLYEGFGLPPLEAMAAGCPTIVSNVASLPEVCGNASVYCDPYDFYDIAEKILSVINDTKLQLALKSKGIEKAREFTWEKCAFKTCEVISSFLI